MTRFQGRKQNMSPNLKKPQNSGPTEMQGRITRTAFLAGVGAATWLIPIVAVALDGPKPMFGLGIGLASTFSISSFLAAVFYGSQRRGFEKWLELDRRARVERDELRCDISDLRDALRTMSQQLHTQIGRVGLTVTQENFNAFGQGVAVGMGGEAAVQETSTRRLPDAQVYRLPLHSKGRNGRS
jgi:hypothetical protein